MYDPTAYSSPTEPIVEQPAVEQTAFEQPAVEQPAVEQAAVEQTAVVQPAYGQPQHEFAYGQPSQWEPPLPEAPSTYEPPAYQEPFREPAPPPAYEQPAHEPSPYDQFGQMPAASNVSPQVELSEQVFEPAPEPQPVLAPEPDQGPAAERRSTRLTVQTMDLHCAGEPLRIVRSGFPEVPHLPVLERRRWVMENADYIRRAIIQEPRGHRDMYGAILLPPYSDYADMTVLFMHNEGYSTMCGHGVIAITTGLIEEGLFPATEPVTTIRYEVPAGIVAANAATVQLENGDWAVQGVRFTNVPSYLAAQSLAVRPDGVMLHGSAAQYGALSVDLAFGGAYYGIVNAAELGLRVVPEQADALRRAGAAITDVLRRDHTPSHPNDAALSFVYGTIIVDLNPRTSPDGKATNAHMRNATIFADAELDRSPCGSGTSAILAQLHARGRIKVGQEIINAGITGEHFLGRIEAETALGPYPAVSTSVAGTAFVTGFSTFLVDSRDPLGEGFLLS
jgi:proline racemase